jgi:hypothetical protein
MALEGRDRKQLLEAREQIAAQLMQLEATASDPYARTGFLGPGPDNRGVYAELQRELQEINELLQEADGDPNSKGSKTGASPYYPLSKDFNQGFQPKRNPIAILLAIITILWLLFVLVRTMITG